MKYKKKKIKKKDEMKILIITILCYLESVRFKIIISTENDMNNIESYLKLCNNSNINDLYFSERKPFPKVSIISPIYNRGEFLIKFLKSIQNQNFFEIEILLIDDCSSDNTVNLIKKYQSIDKRIVLIKNKKNFGTFKSRNLGILKSTGKYLILPDPDDILSQNCLKIFYIFATKYKYELLRFNLYIGQNRIFLSDYVNATPSLPVFRPKIQTFLFYAAHKLRQIDFNISNKFIKREALIRALNCFTKAYLNMHITNFEDGILNYILYRTVESFYFLKKIGYYYIKNRDSITIKRITSDTIRCIFIHLNVVFEFSKNTFYEKNMFNALFKRLVIRKSILKRTKLMKANLKFYIDSINIFSENEFVSINNKNYLIKLKNSLIKA